MPWIEKYHDNAADAITGDRIFPGNRVFNTAKSNMQGPYQGNSKTRLLKEETIVWLAEEAGLRICKGDCNCASGSDAPDAGVLEPAPVVERADVSAGDGEVEARKPTPRRRKAAQYTNGPVEGE